MFKGFAKHLRGQVLSLCSVACTAGDVCIDQLEIFFVKLRKPRAIALSGFHQTPLIFSGFVENSLCRFTAGHCLSMYMNSEEGKRLRRGWEIRGANVSIKPGALAPGSCQERRAEPTEVGDGRVSGNI